MRYACHSRMVLSGTGEAYNKLHIIYLITTDSRQKHSGMTQHVFLKN
ncbi:MAG: hypothetical protein QGG64_14670 [Candidatus Latescibacteria bacterium]|jgi:hypothetical protein|nr:hypothetical protein [Candidatus Latescibacterota bacterium]